MCVSLRFFLFFFFFFTKQQALSSCQPCSGELYSALILGLPLNKVNRRCYGDGEGWINILFLFELAARPWATVQQQTSFYHSSASHWLSHLFHISSFLYFLYCIYSSIQIDATWEFEKSHESYFFGARSCKRLKKDLSLSNRAHRESS